MLHVVLNRTECSQALGHRFLVVSMKGRNISNDTVLSDYMGLGPPGEWVCCVCLVYKQDWPLNEASPLSAAVMETIVANSHRSLSSKGEKCGTPWLAHVTRLNGMAVWAVEEEMEAFWEFPKWSFSSAMHVDFTPSSSKALSCEI